ncbi:lytic transglycosylase domain-containing protein [Pseudoxanthomonas suwonensis]|uniref:Transglycosylase n=1 Tax=Pseudoxanthomonas suwonensis TaxID=314722 RepID=A0A0E3Z4J3_9GAMM|nr:lytic transglycosylase domain-containing protein [Pseudoxanthomonas suwonensis]AKC87458.1 transglycosylase [Pseudoxanthomonas suwonensis]
MKGMLGKAGVLLLALVALPASAGTLYRCVGADGVSSYVNKRVPGAECRVHTRYTPDRSQPRPAKAAPAPAAVATAAATAAGDASAPVMTPAANRSDAIVPAALPAARTTPPQRRVSGQVYSYMKDGVRHFSSRPPARGGGASEVRTVAYSYIETCYACGVNPGVSFATVRLNTSAYQAEIAAAAREFGVEEAIVRAIIHAESAFNPAALSHAGAQGLMQLMPPTARRFGVTDSYDASQNIRGGVQYLAWLLRRYDGDLTLAAAGYNAGEGAVDRHKGVPPYSETQRYVQRVGVLAERYRGVLAAR